MESSDIYRLLSPQIRRLLVVYRILPILGTVATSVAILIPPARMWALVLFPATVAFATARIFIMKRNLAAVKISWRPQLVYWVHPAPLYQRDPQSIDDCKTVWVHLRNGEKLEVSLSRSDMRAFTGWLHGKNPSVRLGNYDTIDPFTGEDRGDQTVV